MLYEDAGRYHEAIRCYRSVLAAFPNHRRARQYLRDAEGSLTMYLDEEHERRPERGNFLLRMPISEFELSVRARNCLAKMDIQTLADLVIKTENELLSYKNFGETTLQEIRSLLSARGLSLGMKLDEDGIPVEEVIEEAAEIEPIPESSLGPVPIPEGIEQKTLNAVLSDLELSLEMPPGAHRDPREHDRRSAHPHGVRAARSQELRLDEPQRAQGASWPSSA